MIRTSLIRSLLLLTVLLAAGPLKARESVTEGRPGVAIDLMSVTSALPVAGQPAELVVNIRNDRASPYPKIDYTIDADPPLFFQLGKGTCNEKIPGAGQCGDAYQFVPRKAGAYTITMTLDPKIRTSNAPDTYQKTIQFEVVPPPPENVAIDVLLPQGGAEWQRGKKTQIQWKTNAPKVGIWLARKSQTMELVANNVAGDSESFEWSVPPSLPLGPGYTVQVAVYKTDGRAVQTFSESLPFSIVANTRMTVLSPQAGDRWVAGQAGDVLISWEGPCQQSNVQIDLLRQDEKIQTLVRPLSFPPALECSGDTARFEAVGTAPPDWIEPGGDYSVHIVVPDGSIVGDSGLFTIDPPENAPNPALPMMSTPLPAGATEPIRILKPGPGDVWQAGQPEKVSIEYECPCRHNNVRIELWRGGGMIKVLYEAGAGLDTDIACSNRPVEIYKTAAYPPSSSLDPGPGYFIRILSADGAAAGDSASFTLMPPAHMGGVTPAASGDR